MTAKPNKSEVLGLQWRTVGGNIAYAYGKVVLPDGAVYIYAVTFCTKLNKWWGRSHATAQHVRENQISVDVPEIENLQAEIEQAVASLTEKGVTLS